MSNFEDPQFNLDSTMQRLLENTNIRESLQKFSRFQGQTREIIGMNGGIEYEYDLTRYLQAMVSITENLKEEELEYIDEILRRIFKINL